MIIAAIAAPLLFAAFVWWFSTGMILWLNRLPQRTFAWTFTAVSAASCVALFLLIVRAGDTTMEGAYVAFTSAVLIWGWHEMSFLMGYIVGPRRDACPADAKGWRRFRFAASTLMHHEIALALTVVAIFSLTWGQPNQVGPMTFLLLWVMRLSAKFNLFLGAPYRAEELMPTHLEHLKSYFRHRRMNALFPVSILGGALLCAMIGAQAFAPDVSAFEQTGLLLMLSLAALGVIEHIFLFVPPPNAALWGWAAPEAGKQDNPAG